MTPFSILSTIKDSAAQPDRHKLVNACIVYKAYINLYQRN